MDDNDRQNIEEHLKLVDTNNHMAISTLNRNIIINDHFNTTFQNIKKAIESDRKQISLRLNSVQHTNQDLHRQLLHLDILLKVKILSDSIEHIQNNLASARLNLMSSNILTNEEIDKYNIDAFKLENIELGVAVSAGNIIFSIKIPTNTTIAKHSFVTPFPNKNFEELQFKNEHILDINNTKYIYSKNLYIGNLKILNTCVIKRNCKKIRNNKEEIIEIKKGLILAKNIKGIEMRSTCNERKLYLEGNKLIIFNDCEIYIANVTYKNWNKSFTQHYVIHYLESNINTTQAEPTFEELIIKQIKNTERIEELTFQKKIHQTNTWIIISFILAIIIALFAFSLYFSKKQKSIELNIITKTQESFRSREGGVTSLNHSAENISPDHSIDKVEVNWSA